MTGYSLTALSSFALHLAFSSPVVTSLLEPWLSEQVKLEKTFEPLPVLCSKCGYRLGTVEGGWIKPGPCRHCPSREGIPFNAMLSMAFALVGPTLTEQSVLAYLDENPIDSSYPRVVEARQPVLFKQAPVKASHKLIHLDDGTIDAILND